MSDTQVGNVIGALFAGGLWGVVKIMFIVGLAVYSMFGLVILRQSQIMSHTIEAKYNFIVKAGAWIHFVLTLFLLLITIVVL